MAAGILVVLGAVGVGVYLLVDSLRDNETQPAPAPSIVVHEQQAPATQDLGFPAFATKNTTRVAGLDPVADAAGVALATFPSSGGVEGPAAVSLVEDDDWASGIAAASLAAQPIRAPILLTGTDDIPDFTAQALSALAPAGSQRDRRQADLHDRLGDRPAGPPSATRHRLHPGRDRRRDRPAAPEADRRPAAAHRAGELQAGGVRDARRRLGGTLGRSGAVRLEECGAEADARRASARQARPGLRAGPRLGDLRQGPRAGPEGGAGRAADRRQGSRAERDRLRALRERQLWLGHQRPRSWIRDRHRRQAAGRRGGRAAVRQRRLGTAADHG